MKQNIVIINSSFRHNGNSEILASRFALGAKESGHLVETINIRDFELKFCRGCLSCQKTEKCIINDGMDANLSKLQNADILVFATPIYYYEMSGQLKTFLDRMNPLYIRKNRFKKVYLLASAADEELGAIDIAKNGIEGFVKCFEGVELVDALRGVNANDMGDIVKTKAYDEAFALGRKI